MNKRLIVRKENMPGWSSTGVVYRLFEEDGFDLYTGSETRGGVAVLAEENWPGSILIDMEAP